MGDTHTDDSAAELTGFQRDCLRAVVLCTTDDDTPEPYGLGIKRHLTEWYGEDVNHGRLYPNLDTLVEMGLLEKEELDKRTNAYRLTESGVEVLQTYKHKYVDAVNNVVGDAQ